MVLWNDFLTGICRAALLQTARSFQESQGLFRELKGYFWRSWRLLVRSTGFVHAWVSPPSDLCMSLKWSHNLWPWNLDLAFHCHNFPFVFSLTSLKVFAYATASVVVTPVTQVDCALIRINVLTSSPPYTAAMFHYTLFCSCMNIRHYWLGSTLPACGDSLRRPRNEQETSFTSSRTSDMWVHDNYIHIMWPPFSPHVSITRKNKQTVAMFTGTGKPWGLLPDALY